ncbi:MAG: DUF2834 domain-containing protein [Ornithinimicrobium sp.]|jgi:membrane associated rhomboid family serine protease|uniref:DUF2834 domain-containing protein n=1 Tax=Ornithinimicrobium sp. TaxID=1977084 RepID=UPI003D9BB98A
MIAVYAVLALVGGAGTWWFNLQSRDQGYLAGWIANSASSSAAVDLIVVALAACLFIVLESRRLGMRFAWVLVPLSFLIAVAFTFPLFLAWRQWHLSRQTAELSTAVVRS